VFILLAGCASTTYKEFIGGHEITGAGGTRQIVDGIEVWENGAPNRPFHVIGIVDDERGGGIIPRYSRLSDISKKARESGGDAVIIYQEGSEIAGFISDSYKSVGGSNAISTSGSSTAVTRLKTKAAVIKYAR
jgi:hypothetical protein